MIHIHKFIRLSNKDIPQAKYKIGEKVKYTHPLLDGEGVILAVSDTGDGIEYAVDNQQDFLLWESEITGKM